MLEITVLEPPTDGVSKKSNSIFATDILDWLKEDENVPIVLVIKESFNITATGKVSNRIEKSTPISSRSLDKIFAACRFSNPYPYMLCNWHIRNVPDFEKNKAKIVTFKLNKITLTLSHCVEPKILIEGEFIKICDR